jgi:predicted dinucleotide-binding enzyme
LGDKFAILGSGNIGGALAGNFARAGLEVVVADRSSAASVMERALAAEIVILAIPFGAVPAAVRGVEWKNRIVVDATNAIDLPAFTPTDLGGRLSTHVLADALPGARVVKAFNTLPAAVLAEDPRDGDRKRTLFVAGDDDAANQEVAHLAERLGYSAIVLGKISEGGRLQQFGGPLTVLDLALRMR